MVYLIYKQCGKWNGMEVMGRDRYLHGKNNFPILFSFFSLSYSSLSFSPPFLSFFLFVFFFSSFQIFLLFFLFFGYCNFLREDEDNI